MKLIQTISVSTSTAASIEFTSIPQTYTDLYLCLSGRSNVDSVELRIQFNGDTTSNYSGRLLFGNGSSASTQSSSTTYLDPMGSNFSSSSANVFSNTSIYVPNYTGSTKKSVEVNGSIENNATEAYNAIFAGLWNGTAAITSVKLLAQGGSWVQYSSASLYGILKGSGGATVS